MQFVEMMVFMLRNMFSLVKSSHNAMVGQLSVLFQPQNMQCFYVVDQKQKRKHGRIIFQGVITGLFPHNNGVLVAGRSIIKCQPSNVVAHFKFSNVSHLCMKLYLTEVESKPHFVLERH